MKLFVNADEAGLDTPLASGDELHVVRAISGGSAAADAQGTAAGDDPTAVTTGFSTSATCGPATNISIKAGRNGVAETRRGENTDDLQLVSFGSMGLPSDADIVLPFHLQIQKRGHEAACLQALQEHIERQLDR